MSVDPYRSSAIDSTASRPATFFYAPQTKAQFGPGCVPFVGCVVLGGIGGVVFDQRVLAVGLGVVAGLVISAWRNRTGDDAGVLLRVRDGVLTIGHGKRGSRTMAEAPLTDVVDVKVETETLLMSIGPRVGSPGFGMDPVGPRPIPTVDESRIAVQLRRGGPVYLTVNRVSSVAAVESVAEIRLFLESHGWQSIEERRRKAKLAKANETGKLSIMGLLVTPTEAASDAVRLVRERFQIELDYSIDSLQQIDDLVDAVVAQARSMEERRTWALLFGCYIGECLVKRADAVWTLIADDEALEDRFDPEVQFVVRVGETIANPIGKAKDWLEEGFEDSFFDFAQRTIALAISRPSS